MEPRNRKPLYLSGDRIAKLAHGESVYVTQNGDSREIIPVLDCCSAMTQKRSTKKGRIEASTWNVCPSCTKKLSLGLIHTNGNGKSMDTAKQTRAYTKRNGDFWAHGGNAKHIVKNLKHAVAV